jgi:hypothetical protein
MTLVTAIHSISTEIKSHCQSLWCFSTKFPGGNVKTGGFSEKEAMQTLRRHY